MGILDVLSRGTNSILVFDCEFWHVKYNNEPVTKVEKRDFFFLPREIGGFRITKNKDWAITEEFFVTLHPPGLNVALPVSNYSTVTARTEYRLNEIEKELGTSWGESFFFDLAPEKKILWKEGLDAYKNDTNIKNHHQPPSWLNKFIKTLSESTVIVKGAYDILAIKNYCAIKKLQFHTPLHIIDIVHWNEESHKQCGSAKLEDTYNCIKNKLSPEAKKIAKKLPIGRAHDPMADAIMTFIIAMYIEKH
jgi:hypothetical protein